MKKCFSNFNLKLLAIITMTIDHITIIFRPPYYHLFRIIGRISFPLFAFLLVEGFIHTNNYKKYLLRLLLLACISELIYDYTLFNKLFTFTNQNIFFTLSLGLITIKILEKIKMALSNQKDKILKNILIFSSTILIIIIIGLTSLLLNFSYGFLGILIISLFYLFRNKPKLLVPSFLLAVIFLSTTTLDLATIFALIPLSLYNGKLGYNNKLLFYSYYPLHLLVLKCLSFLI